MSFAMDEAGDVGRRLDRLDAIADIQTLKAEYAAAADAKYRPDRTRMDAAAIAVAAARQAACFTEDAVWDGGRFGGRIIGRPALQAFFDTAPWQFATHLYSAPAVSIDGATATATWRLWQLAVTDPDERTVVMAGTTHETYRRTSEGWRVASMRFDTLHSVVVASDPAALKCLIPLGDAA